MRSGHALGSSTDAQLLDAAERYAAADAALQAALRQCGATSIPHPRRSCTLTSDCERAGDAGAYLDVLRAAPVLDGRVFVEMFARGRPPASGDMWLARAAWHAAAYINSCAVESDAVRCLLDTGTLLAGTMHAWRSHRFRAGALRLSAQLGSSAAERDGITAHAYQLMLAAMRAAASCPAVLVAEVKACLLGGHADGYSRYAPAVRASRDAAARLLGLELLREFCRDKKSGLQAQLADEYYASAAAGLQTDIPLRGSASARYLSVFHDDPVETCWSIR